MGTSIIHFPGESRQTLSQEEIGTFGTSHEF
jgi:hypothetical protein